MLQKTHDVSRTHGIWCDSTIVRYLADERYTGTYIRGKRAVLEVGGNNSRFKDRSRWYIIPDHHPAIVDKALFDKVQETVRRFSQPLIIMASLPFAIIGAVLGLLVAGQTANMMSMIGFIMLLGLVTKNAILLLDYANQLPAGKIYRPLLTLV